jgi:cytochrome c biogenesis protein CcmG/thiol:disulfide interchange protein DsbE
MNATKVPAHLAAALAALAVVVVAGCGSSTPRSQAPDYTKALAGSPKPLAALHEQAGELLGGGTAAYEARLRDLRGYPVVVNKWASWCGPCRAEFPYFQRASAKLGRSVAFVGVDSNDSDSAAKEFLGQLPVPYPSFTDPDQKISLLLKAQVGFPSTAFYDRSGKLVYTHIGQYPSLAELESDIRRYAS